MPLVWKDRVMVLCSTTGTGTLALGGALTGYREFAVVGDGNQVDYMIEAIDNDGLPTGDWEIGQGTFGVNGNRLTRDTIYASSNGGSPVNFGEGTKRVFSSPSAA